jgi:hypothetical protein
MIRHIGQHSVRKSVEVYVAGSGDGEHELAQIALPFDIFFSISERLSRL